MTNTGGSAGDGLSPGNTREADDHHDEPHAMGRLLFRSALLALMVPVFEGQFWNVKAIQVVLALVLCLLLYGFEKIICWLSRNRLRTKPISSAAYRGGIVYG